MQNNKEIDMAKGKVGVHGTDAETGRKDKKACPITKTQFREKAPNAVSAGNVALLKKEFATGTLGYFAQISVTVEVDGVPVKLTGNAQLYVPNSKEAGE